MKKQIRFVILGACLSLFTLAANAQTTFKKADKIVEGTVSYTKATDVKATWSLNPTVGYFLTDKIALGVSGQFGEAAGTKTTNVGVFGRYYVANVLKGVLVYSQLDLASNTSEVAGKGTNTLSGNIGLGANYFVTKNLALSAGVANLISYQTADSKSILSVGFTGVNNPLSFAKFGVLYRF